MLAYFISPFKNVLGSVLMKKVFNWLGWLIVELLNAMVLKTVNIDAKDAFIEAMDRLKLAFSCVVEFTTIWSNCCKDIVMSLVLKNVESI